MNELAFELTSGYIEKATKDSAAFDLFYSGKKPLWVGDQPVLIPTGVFTKFSPGLVCIMKEKSGLALKGLELKAGVIDADYRKEWGVLARNPIHVPLVFDPDTGEPSLPFSLTPDPSWKPYKVEPGEKVAQFLIIQLPAVHTYSMTTGQIIYKNELREGGFGSSGLQKAISDVKLD